MTELLYSRYRDGAIPVEVIQMPGKRTFSISSPDAPPVSYSSARKLLIRLTGHPEARHWTYARYFRQGRFAPASVRVTGEPALTILELFGPDQNVTTEIVTDVGGGLCPTIIGSRSLTVRGIDLEHRGNEVAKLLFAGFGNKIKVAGYEPSEVLQEVYKGILIRNRGGCAWDPAKSSFGHYVHMVCGCVMSNYHRRMSRQRGREQIGVPGFGEAGERTTVDVASAGARLPMNRTSTAPLDAEIITDIQASIQRGPRAKTSDAVLAIKILPLVREGFGRRDIAERLNESRAAVSRALGIIRNYTRLIIADMSLAGPSLT